MRCVKIVKCLKIRPENFSIFTTFPNFVQIAHIKN